MAPELERFILPTNDSYLPTQWVPNEIWATIFVHCLPISTSNYPHSKTSLMDPRNMPILLSSVCRLWRQTACSTPELWATCWLNFLHPELNTVWLDHAAGYPKLSLYGSFHGIHIEWDRFLGSILPFQKRWESLGLDIPWAQPEDDKYLHEITKAILFEDSEPTVSTAPMDDRVEAADWVFAFISNAPTLRKLMLGNISLHHWNIRSKHQPFPSLSTLEITFASEGDMMWILKRLPLLRHLSCCLTPGHLSGTQRQPIKHTSLANLHISGDMSGVFGNLTLPSLRNFHGEWGLKVNDFIAFLNRSRCCLAELSLVVSTLNSGEVTSILQHGAVSHFVEKLELFLGTRRTLSALFLRFLRDSAEGGHLSQLTQLSIQSCNFRQTPPGLVADVVASLCSPNNHRVRDLAIHSLDRSHESLDIARIIPLPEDKPLDVRDIDSDAISTIKLVTTTKAAWNQDGKWVPPYPHTMKIWLGESSSRTEHIHEHEDH